MSKRGGMTGWVHDFFIGVMCILRGLGMFVSRPRYWSYLSIPVILNTFIYIAGIWFFMAYAWPWTMGLLPENSGGWWNDLWYYPLAVLAGTVLIALVVVVFVFTFTSVFFIVASPFLDWLTLFIERTEYGREFKFEGKRGLLSYYWTSLANAAWLGMKILFWTVALLPISFFVPYVGMLPFIFVIGYLFALTFLFYSVEHRRMDNRRFKTLLCGKRTIVLGFGIASYFALFIPFVAIALLPAAVIGGVILFNEYLEKEDKNLSDLDNVVSDEQHVD